jgi:hypothetical protein
LRKCPRNALPDSLWFSCLRLRPAYHHLVPDLNARQTFSHFQRSGIILPLGFHQIVRISRHDVRVHSKLYSSDREYPQRFRHIQYNRIASLRPIVLWQCFGAHASPSAGTDVASPHCCAPRLAPPPPATTQFFWQHAPPSARNPRLTPVQLLQGYRGFGTIPLQAGRAD